MDAGLVSFIAVLACSTASLAVLGATDPKRRGQRGDGSVAMRTLRAGSLAACLLPGLWPLMRAEGGYFLMWVGYLTVCGWVVALLLQRK